MVDFNEINVFGDKTMADLFQQIYNNQVETGEAIDGLIEQMQQLITSINDATIIAPVVKDFLEANIKNNDVLIKIVAIVERSMSRLDTGGSNESFFTEEDLMEIRRSASKITSNENEEKPELNIIPLEYKKIS